MKTNVKNEQTPLTSIDSVVTIKKKFGSPEEGRNGVKRQAEEVEHETPRQTRPSVYIPYNYILYHFRSVAQNYYSLQFHRNVTITYFDYNSACPPPLSSSTPIITFPKSCFVHNTGGGLA